MVKQAKATATEDIMTVHELAKYLRLSEAKVYRMANAGCLPAFRIGRSWRFKMEAIDEWILQETGHGSLHHAVTFPPAEDPKPLGTTL